MSEGHWRLLLIEDNPGDQVIVRRLLRGQAEVTAVETLNEGERCLREQDFDCVLLDLGLPDCSGLGGVRRLKELSIDRPIVVLTGLDDDQLAAEAVREGAQDYLYKGALDRRLLERTIRYAIERQIAQKALASAEQHWRTVMENMPDQVMTLDRAGTVTWLNRAEPGLPGVQLGTSLLRLLEDAGLPLAPTLERVLETWSDASLQLGTREGGSRRWFSLHIGPYVEPGGEQRQARGAVLVVRETTEQHLLQDQLQHAQKLEAVGRLAGGIAHDFNNLLSAILGLATLVKESTAEEVTQHDAEEIIETVHRAARLTEQLLAFSRRQPAEPRVLDVGAVLQDVSRMLRRLLGEDIQLKVAPLSAPVFVRMDRSHLEQVVMNLAVNAREAMPDGGRLSIEANLLPAGSTLLPLAPGEESLCLRIADTGHGMTEEVQRRIFEPFFTTRADSGGSGLGLATTYGIVKTAGGSIHVESAPGVGTTFYIRLPTCPPPSEAEPDPSRPRRPRGRGEVVLVVDDVAIVRAATVRVLRAAGYTVLQAGNGEEALDRIREAEPPVDLLVADVVMPRMGGHELVEILRQEGFEVPVLLMSGLPGNGAPTNLEEPVMAKPVRPDDLLDRVRASLDRAPASDRG